MTAIMSTLRLLPVLILLCLIPNITFASNTLFTSTSTIEYFVTQAAKIHHVDPQMALFIANHESGLNPQAIGDDGKSVGLWQINLSVHKDLTRADALDVVSSTLWSMPHLQKEPKIWSTWSKRYEWYYSCQKPV